MSIDIRKLANLCDELDLDYDPGTPLSEPLLAGVLDDKYVQDIVDFITAQYCIDPELLTEILDEIHD